MAGDQELVAVAQRRDVPQDVCPVFRVGVLERRVRALFHEVAGEKGAGRAYQEVAVGVAAAQVEEGGGESAEVNQDGLILDDRVGNDEFDGVARPRPSPVRWRRRSGAGGRRRRRLSPHS